MANIQEDITSQVWDLFLRFFSIGSDLAYQIPMAGADIASQAIGTVMKGAKFSQNFIENLLAKRREAGKPIDEVAQMLLRNKKGGETLQTMPVPEEEAADLAAFLEKRGILFTTIDNPGDDTKFFIFMSGDAEIVWDAVTIWKAEIGKETEIDADLFLDNYADVAVGTLTGLDDIDLSVFKEYAAKNGLVFSSVMPEGDESVVILYKPEQRKLAEKTLSETLWTLSGEDGARIKEQMAILARNRKQLNRSFKEAEKEYYIVNGKAPKNYVHLTANDFTYYKGTKEIMNVHRNKEDFIGRGIRVVDGMEKPIVLTREEYESFMLGDAPDFDGLQKLVEQKAAQIPEPDLVRAAQEKQNEKMERLISKLQLDDENSAGFWIYDDSISFSEGGEYEDTEDIDEQVKEDLAAARLRAARCNFHEVSAVDKGSLDYYIAEAEKLRSQSAPENSEPDRDL